MQINKLVSQINVTIILYHSVSEKGSNKSKFNTYSCSVTIGIHCLILNCVGLSYIFFFIFNLFIFNSIFNFKVLCKPIPYLNPPASVTPPIPAKESCFKWVVYVLIDQFYTVMYLGLILTNSSCIKLWGMQIRST